MVGCPALQGASEEVLQELAHQFEIEAPLKKGGSLPFDLTTPDTFHQYETGVMFSPALRQRIVLSALREPLHKGGCGFS